MMTQSPLPSQASSLRKRGRFKPMLPLAVRDKPGQARRVGRADDDGDIWEAEARASLASMNFATIEACEGSGGLCDSR